MAFPIWLAKYHYHHLFQLAMLIYYLLVSENCFFAIQPYEMNCVGRKSKSFTNDTNNQIHFETLYMEQYSSSEVILLIFYQPITHLYQPPRGVNTRPFVYYSRLFNKLFDHRRLLSPDRINIQFQL